MSQVRGATRGPMRTYHLLSSPHRSQLGETHVLQRRESGYGVCHGRRADQHTSSQLGKTRILQRRKEGAFRAVRGRSNHNKFPNSMKLMSSSVEPLGFEVQQGAVQSLALRAGFPDLVNTYPPASKGAAKKCSQGAVQSEQSWWRAQ